MKLIQLSLIILLSAVGGFLCSSGVSAADSPVSISAAVTPVIGMTTGSPFAQGVTLFRQQQYAQAVTLFQKALKESSGDSKACYYLGMSLLMSGDVKDAAVALGLSNKLNPDPSVAAYDRVKSGLSAGDRQWVESQVASGNGGKGQPTMSSGLVSFGIRLEPAVFFVNLKDFQADSQTNYNAIIAGEHNGYGYPNNYDGKVPWYYFGRQLEPVVKFGSGFEIGLPLAILPLDTYSELYSNSPQYGSNNGEISYKISAFSIGLNGRVLIDAMKDLQFFVAGGPCFIPISIDYEKGGGTFWDDLPDQSGALTSSAFGGQIQLGLDWRLGDNFMISSFGGYLFAQAGTFTGTLNGSTSSSGQLEVTNTVYGNRIYFLPSGTSPNTFNDRPFQMDLSGPFAGVQLSALF